MQAVKDDAYYMLQYPCNKPNAWMMEGYAPNVLHKVKFNDNTDGYVKKVKAKRFGIL